jgi:hypothetical protein
MFWHFLNAIVRASLYRVYLCPSNWSVMALKKCRNLWEMAYLLCSHFSAREVGLINWKLSLKTFVN